MPGSNWHAGLLAVAEGWERRQAAIGNVDYLTSEDSFKLSPTAECEVCRLRILGNEITNTLDGRFSMEVTYGCDGSPTQKFATTLSHNEAGIYFGQFRSRNFSEQAASNFLESFLSGGRPIED